MKRAVAYALLISLLLLSGCGGNEVERFAEFSQKLDAAGTISFTAALRAEYDDKTAEFKLACVKTADETTVEIIEPELLAGIKARVTGEDAKLEYDGAMLDIGTLSDNGLCPMSALPYLVRAMCETDPDLAWTEDNMLAARLIPEDGMMVTLWLDENLVPCNAEITCGEKTVVFVEISDWKLE